MAHPSSHLPHSRPGWRVERKTGKGWEELGPAWSLGQAFRLLATRRGHLEQVRVLDQVTGLVNVELKPGDLWEYELWR